jgi:hypothetical protein
MKIILLLLVSIVTTPIMIIWSIVQSIAMMILPKYGLKRARLIYSKTGDVEDAQRVEDFEWKVRRKYGNKEVGDFAEGDRELGLLQSQKKIQNMERQLKHLRGNNVGSDSPLDNLLDTMSNAYKTDNLDHDIVTEDEQRNRDRKDQDTE